MKYGVMINGNVSEKSIKRTNKIIVGILAHVFVTLCHDIINIADSVSTNVTSTNQQI